MIFDIQYTVSIVDLFTIAIASIGAFLGIMNTWRAMLSDKVKLKVVPKTAIPIGPAAPDVNFAIEVLNKSSFSVTINEVGFLVKGSKSRAAILNPFIIDGGEFPRRLEPRSSFSVHCKLKEPVDGLGSKIKCAYAQTDCGEIKRGKSKALIGRMIIA